jgi:hypothetical protein
MEVRVRMKSRVTVGAGLAAAALLAGCAFAAEGFKSGPQPGDHMGIFDPMHVNGSAHGQKACLV